MSTRVLAPPPAALQAELAELDLGVAAGWLRPLDRALAGFLARQSPQAEALAVRAAAWVSHQLGRGHVCLDLGAVLADADAVLGWPPTDSRPPAVTEPLPTRPSQALAGVDLARWSAALAQAPWVAVVRTPGGAPGGAPLVLDGPRLYLRRHWQSEQDVRAAIAARLAEPWASTAGADAALAQALAALFPAPAGGATGAGPDWQKLACALAARQRFALITGGPGTGKTTTVVRLLAALQHLARAQAGAPALRIRLAAPTGKAAARLGESIARTVASLPLAGLPQPDALRASIPTEVTTVHRLLGSRPDTRRLRHDAAHPLPLDVLVIDEASMLDLAMTAAVMAALPAQARLVLLGDKDQLASVEAGAVLGELGRRADGGHYTAQTAQWLEAVTGERLAPTWIDTAGRALDQAVVKLRVSHRFEGDSGIGRLAEAVNTGDVSALHRTLAQRPPDLSRWTLATETDWHALLVEGAPQGLAQAGQGRRVQGAEVSPPHGWRHCLAALRAARPEPNAPAPAWDAWALGVLQAQSQFQLLCALREGPFGVAGLNQRVAQHLRAEGLLGPEAGAWYEGRPVMVTRNDPALRLMNGDVGMTLRVPQRGAGEGALAAEPAPMGLRVAFAAPEAPEGVRWVLPSRLRDVDTVFAMTVHKSQGSEFTHAALLLPDTLNPVLTRELVYTGLTRARHWCTLALPPGAQGVLDAAVQRRVQRASGLAIGP